MNDFKRRALEEARADAAHEARAASSVLGRFAARIRLVAAFVRVAVARPWGSGADREPVFAGVGRDLRYALRRLRQAPTFTVFTIISLAVAIGAATAVYAVVHAVMGPPPGVIDPERVLVISHVPQGSAPMASLSWPDYEDLQAREDVFDHLAGWVFMPAGYVANDMSGSGVGEWVTGEYFDVLGVRATIGRTLRVTDDDPSAPPVAVISHALWQRSFAGSEHALGAAIRVNGVDYHVVGVIAEDFRGLFNGGLAQTSVWLPMSAARSDPGFARMGRFDQQSRDRRWVSVRGRLASHQTLEQAAVQIAGIARQLDEEFPLGLGLDPQYRRGYNVNRNAWTAKPLTGRMFGVPDELAQRLVMALLTAVGLVLLVAATNLANLATARATRRRQELSVRRALGASRFRLVRETLAESLILAVVGGLLSLAVAHVVMRVLGTELTINALTLQADPRFDWQVLLWTFGATSLVLMVAGLVPAFVSTRGIRSTLTSENVTTTGRWRGRRYLIALQVAVSVVLVVLASVFVAHVRQQATIDTGLDLDRLALAEIDFGSQGYDEPRARRFVNDVLTRLRRPDVESVSVSSGLPVSLRTPGASVRSDRSDAPVELVSATSDIARTLGLSLVHGRLFDQRDAGGPPAVVLNEATAAKLFGSTHAVGQSVILERRPWVGDPDDVSRPRTLTVVGVVSDTDAGVPGRRDRGVAYLPFDQHYESRLVISARTSGDPAVFVDDLRRTIAAVDSRLAIAQIGTGMALAGPDTRFQKIVASIAGLLGTFALVLALAGLYGVMAHLVSARTREVGLKIALGATPARIQRMVIREGLSPVVLGLVAGLGLAILVGMGARATLRGFDPHFGIASLMSVGGLFILAGVLACYVPARRASRVDPNQALRRL